MIPTGEQLEDLAKFLRSQLIKFGQSWEELPPWQQRDWLTRAENMMVYFRDNFGPVHTLPAFETAPAAIEPTIVAPEYEPLFSTEAVDEMLTGLSADVSWLQFTMRSLLSQLRAVGMVGEGDE